MTTQQRNWKRRNYLINPGFQLRFMFYIACGMLTGFAVIYFTNHWYINILNEQGRELGLNPGHIYFEFVDQQRRLMNIAFAVVCTAVFTVLMVCSMLLSHKIAGPIYRVNKYSREVIAGDVPAYPVSLRKGDFFPELATMVNDLVAHSQQNAVASSAAAEDAKVDSAEVAAAPRKPASIEGTALEGDEVWSMDAPGRLVTES
ncbi:MAG: hypothetical protein QNI86_11835 [Halieaceae bacterium]|nr:hypothetical protein [Halieaceae bacterium]